MSDLTISVEDLLARRRTCDYLALTLRDRPTEHDLMIARKHIPGCTTCSVAFANFYRTEDEANGGAA